MLDRLKFGVGSVVAYRVMQIIGRTLRWEVEGWEHFETLASAGRRMIYAFWHGRIFPAAYFWRRRGIVVMTSRHRDAEYIARVIRRFGCGTARGSSSRGSRRALEELLGHLRGNADVAFAVDGPRGPRYVAKSGAVWLAAKSGCPVLPFHISLRNKWVLPSWDHFQIPRPFTRALVLIDQPIEVNPGANEEQLQETQQRLQRSLESLLERGDSRWAGRTA